MPLIPTCLLLNLVYLLTNVKIKIRLRTQTQTFIRFFDNAHGGIHSKVVGERPTDRYNCSNEVFDNRPNTTYSILKIADLFL